MAKYGIGARVRDPDGDLCEVIGKPGGGERECRVLGGKFDGVTVNWPKSSLVPANDQEAVAEGDKVLAGQDVSENACGWVPKVGDRVRVIDPTALRIDTPIGCEGVVTRVGHGEYFDIDLTHPTDGVINQWVSARNVELVPPLTITAGGFYRTRDGRKVGPAQLGGPDGGPDGWPWRCGDGVTYRDNGMSQCNDLPWAYDLVAEWVEPEPEVAVAEATATTFKIGDKVRVIATGSKPARHIGTEFTINSDEGTYQWDGGEQCWAGEGNPYRWLESQLELVTPATPPAKFKVGDRVRIEDDDPDVATVASRNREGLMSLKWDFLPSAGVEWWSDSDLTLVSDALPIGSTVTFTATGHLSAINENGHYQVTFPGLPAARNSFALPAEYVSLAN